MTNSNSRGAKLGEILADLKAEYQQNFPQRVARLRELREEQKWDLLTEEFHKLKGTGQTYGYPEVSHLCEILEHHCRQGAPDARVLTAAFDIFERMQQTWRENEPFQLRKDPDAPILLALPTPPRAKARK